jgi:periplasmic divalent cation tolerance protein
MASAYLQVLTTVDSRDAAERVGRVVVEARVAACAQVVGPIHSTYWWEGKVEAAEEWQVLMKTTEQRYAELERVIRQAHTYDVPEIIATPITGGGADYLSWVEKETRPA